MNKSQLKRSVQSVGMMCFVKYYQHFSDPSINSPDLVEFLMKKENWQENGCRTRVNQARRILKERKLPEALHMIVNSKKTDISIRNKAEELLKSLS